MGESFDRFIKFGNTGKDSVIIGDDGKKPLNPNEIFDPEDGIVTPQVGPRKSEGKPIIMVIDDDYSTLDIMRIYLQRDYQCTVFANPKDAIFYLNTHLPDAIFVDSYMSGFDTKQLLEIIRSYKELSDVPIYYLVDEDEKRVISVKLPKGVLGCLTRPVARGDLQVVLEEIKRITSETNADSEVINSNENIEDKAEG